MTVMPLPNTVNMCNSADDIICQVPRVSLSHCLYHLIPMTVGPPLGYVPLLHVQT